MNVAVVVPTPFFSMWKLADADVIVAGCETRLAVSKSQLSVVTLVDDTADVEPLFAVTLA